MEILLFLWVLLAPDEPVTRLVTAAEWGDPDVRIAMLAPDWPRVLRNDGNDDLRALYASHYLGALLHAGRAAEAVAVWDSLAPRTRARVLAGGSAKVLIDGAEVDRNFLDVRLDLAAALALRGRTDEALPLIPNDDDDNPLVKLVRSYVTRSAGDPYDIVVAFADRSRIPLFGRLVYAQMFAEVATRHGYGRVGDWVYERATEHYRWDGGRQRLPDEVLQERKRVRAETARLVLRKPPVIPSDGMSRRIARSLAAPRIIAYTEKPLPPSMQPAPSMDVARAPTLWPVRVEGSGDDTVTVALWDSVYCLVRTDGKPLATGLRITDGYKVARGSELPIFQGDRVRLEVEGGKYVELALADLLRDSDADGLTDLTEEHLLTDPGDADTDGDGIRDGVDMLPLVALRAGTSDEAEIFRVVLGSQKGAAFVEGSRDDFRQLRADTPLIVLTPEEMALAKQKLGIALSIRFEPIVIDRQRTKAMVQWSYGTSGGTFFLERRNGIWVKMKDTSWIS